MEKLEAGMVCGWLTLLEPVKKSQGEVWRCRCRCGKEIEASGFKLRSGRRTSCGCKTTALDLAGHQYGDFIAIERVNRAGNGGVVWRCECVYCGAEKMMNTTALRKFRGVRCKECKKRLDEEERKRLRAERCRETWAKKRPQKPTRPAGVMTMEEINARAREKGLTYGQYVSRYGTKRSEEENRT